MDTNGGAITGINVEKNRARDYYRRAGFDGFIIRDSPNIQESDIVPIRETFLSVDDLIDLVVYPELGLRKKGRPWRFWGQVVEINDAAIIVRQVQGENANTRVRIPIRYFKDGRVFRKD
jgi:hypothetical protein